jgi:hypothetical protein
MTPEFVDEHPTVHRQFTREKWVITDSAHQMLFKGNSPFPAVRVEAHGKVGLMTGWDIMVGPGVLIKDAVP